MPSDTTLANYKANYDRVVKRLGSNFTAEQALEFVKSTYTNLGTKNCYLSALKHYANPEDKIKFQTETKQDLPTLQEQQQSQTLPDNKLDKVLTWDEITKAYEDAYELSRAGKFPIEHLVVLGLYSLTDPVRLDYANMEYLATSPHAEDFKNDTAKNFCWLGDKACFVFNHYKTASKYGTFKKISIPDRLLALLKLHQSLGNTLVFNGLPNNLGKRLNSLLTKLTGKSCTLNLIRHARINKLYEKNPTIVEKDALARTMLHSYTEGERYRIVTTLRPV
jgi:hypothetical protein